MWFKKGILSVLTLLFVASNAQATETVNVTGYRAVGRFLEITFTTEDGYSCISYWKPAFGGIEIVSVDCTQG